MTSLAMTTSLRTLILILAAGGSVIAAGAKAYFNAEFKMTMTGMTSAIVNDVYPDEKFYNNGYGDGQWNIQRVGSQGLCAVCTTHNGQGLGHDTRLTSPIIHIASDAAILRWQAVSVLPGFAESYNILVQPVGSREPDVIFSTEGEPYDWQYHIVSLEEYAGKDVRISVQCTSRDKFMLAIDNFYIGEPDDNLYAVTDNTRRFGIFKEEHHVTGSITNLGRPQRFLSVVSSVDGTVYGRYDIWEHEWATGRTIDFDLPVLGDINIESVYTLSGENPDGTLTELFSGSFMTGYYDRTVLLDGSVSSGTGTSPRVNYYTDLFRSDYGRNVSVVLTHTNDIFDNTDYLNAAGLDVKSMTVNRDTRYAGDTDRAIRDGFKVAAETGISLTSYTYDEEDRSVTLGITVESYKALTNTNDRYRLGYIVTADMYDPDNAAMAQTNNATASNFRQYFFLPKLIPAELSYMRDVNIGCSEALGIPGTLPAKLAAGRSVPVTMTVPIPDTVTNWRDADITVFVIDSSKPVLLNCLRADLATDILGTDDITDDLTDITVTTPDITVIDSDICVLTGIDGPCRIDIHALDGRLLHTTEVTVSGRTVVPVPDTVTGPVIIRATAAGVASAVKAVIR